MFERLVLSSGGVSSLPDRDGLHKILDQSNFGVFGGDLGPTVKAVLKKGWGALEVPPGPLYRGLSVPDGSFRAFLSGGVALKKRWSSWADRLDTALEFGELSVSAAGGDFGIVFSSPPGPSVSVKALMDSVGYKAPSADTTGIMAHEWWWSGPTKWGLAGTVALIFTVAGFQKLKPLYPEFFGRYSLPPGCSNSKIVVVWVQKKALELRDPRDYGV